MGRVYLGLASVLSLSSSWDKVKIGEGVREGGLWHPQEIWPGGEKAIAGVAAVLRMRMRDGFEREEGEVRAFS